MTEELLGVGIKFPATVSSRGGITLVKGWEKIKSSWLLILKTKKGSVMGDRNFGVDLERMVFKQGDQVSENQAEYEIRTQLELYEPRASVDDVVFYYPAPGQVDIFVTGTVLATGKAVELTYKLDEYGSTAA